MDPKRHKELQYKHELLHIFSRKEIGELLVASKPIDGVALLYAMLETNKNWKKAKRQVGLVTYVYFHGHNELTDDKSVGITAFVVGGILYNFETRVWKQLQPSFEQAGLKWE